MRPIVFSLLMIFTANITAQDLSKLYEKVLPSVVKIYTKEDVAYPDLGFVTTSGGLGSGVLIDEEGIIQYVDVHDIDEQPSNDVIFEEIARLNPEGAKTLKESQPEKAELPKGGVVMYCNGWCPDCKKARLWLKERNIEYTEVDLYTTPGAPDQVREWTGGDLVTPTFDIDGTIIIDFNEEELAKTLKV